MNNKEDLTKLINICVEEMGVDRLKKVLVDEISKSKSADDSLTIIANQGLHQIPPRFIHGELYVASSGNLNFENQKIIVEQYKKILLNLRQKLFEKEWKKVYLVPTGHSTLALQIKNLVYQVLRINTIDLFYSKGNYYEIEIESRSFLV